MEYKFEQLENLNVGDRVIVRHLQSGVCTIARVVEEKSTFFRLNNTFRISKGTFLPKPLSHAKKVKFYAVSESSIEAIESVNKMRKLIPKMQKVDLHSLEDSDLEVIYLILSRYFKVKTGGKKKGYKYDRGKKHFEAFTKNTR